MYCNSDRKFTDGYDSRMECFRSALVKIEELNPRSVAFPKYIGCGLAGGDWNMYLQMITSFDDRNPTIDVVIYKL